MTKHSVFLGSILFVFLLVSALLAYFYVFQYLPAQETLLKKNLYEKAAVISQLSKSLLAKAIASKDDISLLSSIESIAGIEDISAAYILDNGGKVIMHNKTGEWGMAYTDDVSRAAIGKKAALLQKSRGTGGYVFSTPLTSSATLCMGLSSQKNDEVLSLARRKAVYTAVIVLVVIISCFSLFMYYRVSVKFGKMARTIRSMALAGPAKMPVETKDEFGVMAAALNEVLGKVESEKTMSSAMVSGSQKELSALIQKLAAFHSGGVIVLDSENRIIALNEKAREFLVLGDRTYMGKHVLDVIRIPALIEAVKDSSTHLNTITETNIQGKTIKTISLGSDGAKPAGTVILLHE